MNGGISPEHCLISSCSWLAVAANQDFFSASPFKTSQRIDFCWAGDSHTLIKIHTIPTRPDRFWSVYGQLITIKTINKYVELCDLAWGYLFSIHRVRGEEPNIAMVNYRLLGSGSTYDKHWDSAAGPKQVLPRLITVPVFQCNMWSVWPIPKAIATCGIGGWQFSTARIL